MKDNKKQIKVSFYAEGETLENFDRLKALMIARGVEIGKGHKEPSSKDIVQFAIDGFFGGNTGGGRRIGASDETLVKIHNAVQTQMKLNKETENTVSIGQGKNAIEVKYEQRTITDRFIRESANVNAKACTDYLVTNGEEVQSHNEWLVKNCGYATDSNVEEAIKNFNRRTSKAQNRAEKAAKGEVE